MDRIRGLDHLKEMMDEQKRKAKSRDFGKLTGAAHHSSFRVVSQGSRRDVHLEVVIRVRYHDCDAHRTMALT